MALGGIAVSGGIAGHGTLIGVNLLYSPLLYDAYGLPLARPAYTLGGDAGVAGYEAAWVIDEDPLTIYKSTASTNDIAVTIIHGASPPTVYGVVLLGHNITAAGVSVAKFEGGMDTNYNTISADLTLNVATLTPAYHLLASPQAYDHWRVRVNFGVSTALQIGEIFLIGMAPLAFARNFNWESIPDKEIGQTNTEGVNGVPRVTARWERLRQSVSFTQLAEAQLTALQLAARNGHVILSPAGSDGRAYFGVLRLEQVTEIQEGYNVNAVFTEAAV